MAVFSGRQCSRRTPWPSAPRQRLEWSRGPSAWPRQLGVLLCQHDRQPDASPMLRLANVGLSLDATRSTCA